MEEETYIRWLFPGIFASGTFLWLAYIFQIPDFSEISEFWNQFLIMLVAGVPVIGFFGGYLVYAIMGGYSGWGTSKARTLCKEKFQEKFKNTLKEFKPCKWDSDIFFSLAAFGVIDEKEKMSDLFLKSARRRWTRCWAAWNSTMGIVFGYVIYTSFYHINFTLNPWDAEEVPIYIAIILSLSGYLARHEVWKLELVWFKLTYGAEERCYCNYE